MVRLRGSTSQQITSYHTLRCHNGHYIQWRCLVPVWPGPPPPGAARTWLGGGSPSNTDGEHTGLWQHMLCFAQTPSARIPLPRFSDSSGGPHVQIMLAGGQSWPSHLPTPNRGASNGTHLRSTPPPPHGHLEVRIPQSPKCLQYPVSGSLMSSFGETGFSSWGWAAAQEPWPGVQVSHSQARE